MVTIRYIPCPSHRNICANVDDSIQMFARRENNRWHHLIYFNLFWKLIHLSDFTYSTGFSNFITGIFSIFNNTITQKVAIMVEAKTVYPKIFKHHTQWKNLVQRYGFYPTPCSVPFVENIHIENDSWSWKLNCFYRSIISHFSSS